MSCMVMVIASAASTAMRTVTVALAIATMQYTEETG